MAVGLPEIPSIAFQLYTHPVKGMNTVRGGIVPWLTAAV